MMNDYVRMAESLLSDPRADRALSPKAKLKTVYVLRVRRNDSEPWSQPSYYRSRKERDADARMNRIIGGIRTHSYEEKMTLERYEEIV